MKWNVLISLPGSPPSENDSLLKKFAVSKSVGVDETDVNYYNSHNVNYHDGHFHTQNTNGK